MNYILFIFIKKYIKHEKVSTASPQILIKIIQLIVHKLQI